MVPELDAEHDDPVFLAAMIELLQQRLKEMKLSRPAYTLATLPGGLALQPSHRPRQPIDVHRTGPIQPNGSMAPPSSPSVHTQRAVSHARVSGHSVLTFNTGD